MPKRKDLTKEQIIAAQSQTRSNLAASRWLNVSYPHYKMWAKFYKDEETGKTLFQKHLNPSGVGIPKFLKSTGKEPALIDIIEGRTNAASFSPEKIKYRLVSDGLLKEECNNCGFHERRVLDYKIPLILHFKDKNKKNYRKENIEFLCYNCFFLTVSDIFTSKQIEGLEDHKPVNQGQVDWGLDDYHYQRLKELGLGDIEDDGLNIVSYV
jgi:hypothetical protein